MGQLRVVHSVYRIEGQHLENPLFLCQDGALLFTGQLSGKMVKCGNFFEEYPGPVSPYGVSFIFSRYDGLIWSYLSSEAQV